MYASLSLSLSPALSVVNVASYPKSTTISGRLKHQGANLSGVKWRQKPAIFQVPHLEEAVPTLHQEDCALKALLKGFAAIHVVGGRGQVAFHHVQCGRVEWSTHSSHLAG